MLDDILNIAVIAATVALISSLSIISGPESATVAEATMAVQLPTVVVVGKRESAVLEDWGLALRFAQPNAWLVDSAPVDVIDVDARGS